MECMLYQQQFVRKAENPFNVRHINDVKNLHPTPYQHANIPKKKNHKFNKHAKFIIIDKLTNTNKPTEILQQCLIEKTSARHHIPKRSDKKNSANNNSKDF